jgi:MFS family permease
MVAAPGLPATILSRGLLTCCFVGGDVYVPYAITTVRHSPTSLGALALTAATMAWTGGSWAQARFVARVGPRRFVRSGECLVVIGLGFMALVLLPSVPPQFGVLAWTVAGGGMGLAYAPLSVTMLDRAEAGREGEATASLQLFDVLGQAMGSGVAGALVASFGASDRHRSGVGLAFGFGAVVGLVALGAGARLPQYLSTSRSTGRRAGAGGPAA